MREIKRANSEDEKLEPSDVFSAMPTVESLKALVSHVMTERVDQRGRNWCLQCFDVSRAPVCVNVMFTVSHHQNCIVLDSWPNSTKRCTGRRMRPLRGRKLWCEHLRSNGFELGASNPALYRSELVNGFCHGDDFVTAAAEYQKSRALENCCKRRSTRDQIGMMQPNTWTKNWKCCTRLSG